jgi:hypothetical protein
MEHKMRGMLRFLGSLLICIYCESHHDIPGFHTDEGAVDWCPCKYIKNHTKLHPTPFDKDIHIAAL